MRGCLSQSLSLNHLSCLLSLMGCPPGWPAHADKRLVYLLHTCTCMYVILKVTQCNINDALNEIV
jgi:hypothetical protein